MYDNDVEVIPLTENVKKYISSGEGLQYETDSDEDDDDDDEEEEEEEEEEEDKEEEEEDEEGQGQGDVIELSSDAGQHADQMEVDEGQAQAQFSAGGQAQGPDPSDNKSVFSADLLRWADKHTETQAAAQLVYAYQHLRVEQVKSADSLQRLTDMRDFNALGVDSVAHVLERYKM
ncbi:hypothetical protein AcW1_006838 [Taiwanofungus camphoratus]|nr:hypothetical protein AcW1_006837 [Antrodia cinnamomea]KAI0955174.1 hypothetical protein AcW1_006838 [Antrodia cinnamomea]